jgi:hypothetical protein
MIAHLCVVLLNTDHANQRRMLVRIAVEEMSYLTPLTARKEPVSVNAKAAEDNKGRHAVNFSGFQVPPKPEKPNPAPISAR